MSPYLPVCCLCLCVCLGVSACVTVCVSVSVWVCVSHVVGVCLTGISGGVRGCVHVCEPVNMSRLGATAPFPSGTIFPERRGTVKLAPAQPRTISLAPPFVGTVWREGVSGLGTQERATGPSPGSSRPIKLGKQPPQCPSLAWSSRWRRLWGSRRPLSSEPLRPPQT